MKVTQEHQNQQSKLMNGPLPATQRYARIWMSLLLLFADTIGLLLAGLLGFGLRFIIAELVNPPFYWNLLALIPIFLVVYALRGLYPAVGLSPVEELRRLSTATSVVFLVFTAFTFWIRISEYFSRLIIAFSWIFALFTVPLSRWVFRTIAVNLGLWGEPVVVVGDGPQTRRVVDFLIARMRFGLLPIVILNGENEPTENPPVLQIPVRVALSKPDLFASVRTAILIDSELPDEFQSRLLTEQGFNFQRLILITDLGWIGSLGVTPYDLEGLLGLELRQNLLDPWHQRIKRAIDILLSGFLGLLAVPIGALIALAIRLDTPGRIFYRHRRIGKSGYEITVWKFRTMVSDADRILENYLADHPELSVEWQENHKLKNDPRITRVGSFLRRTSLDEIPQLWNAMKGEMSLVGPRPIVADETEKYQAGYQLYKRVRPGITGLWQVSRRTDTSYADRVRYDEYYVRNWSIWLDIYIILRTVWVVLRGDGAY